MSMTAERFAELQEAANREIPKTIVLGREIMVRAQLITLIREEQAA